MRRVILSLRLALEAVIVVVLFNATVLLIGITIIGKGVHIGVDLLGIAISSFIALILVLDALRVRVKLNVLDAARFPSVPEIGDAPDRGTPRMD